MVEVEILEVLEGAWSYTGGMRRITLFVPLWLSLFACMGSPTSIPMGLDTGPVDEAGASDGSTLDAGQDAAAPIAPPLESPTLWLDARKMVPGDGPSKKWKDESGNNNDATAGIALSVEASAINGRPAIYLPGEADQALQVPPNGWEFTIGNGFCVVLVAKTKKTGVARTAQAVLFDRSVAAGGSSSVPRYGSSMYLDSALTKSSAFVFTSTFNSTAEVSTDVFAPHIYVFRVSGSKLDAWVDGKLGAVTASITPNDFSSANSAPFAVGGYSSTNNNAFTFNGHIGEVLVYNRTISDPEIATLIIKLRSDWAIN